MFQRLSETFPLHGICQLLYESTVFGRKYHILLLFKTLYIHAISTMLEKTWNWKIFKKTVKMISVETSFYLKYLIIVNHSLYANISNIVAMTFYTRVWFITIFQIFNGCRICRLDFGNAKDRKTWTEFWQ